MTNSTTQDDVGTVIALLNEAFPNLKCLRCGNESFSTVDAPVDTNRILRDYMIGPIKFRPGQPKTIGLVCNRCGMIEQHSTEVLEKASKPIAGADNG